jgi:succinyl-CoA synthetase beta subunit
VDSVEQAEQAAAEILTLKVKDIPVQRLLVTEKMNICDEYYAAITVDRDSKSIVLIFSDAGGVDIEETAAKTPEKVRQLTLSGASTVTGPSVNPVRSQYCDGAGDVGLAVTIDYRHCTFTTSSFHVRKDVPALP